MTVLDAEAAGAYDALAAHYDLLTASYDHERWWHALEGLLRDHGLRGRRAIDIGCGTGRSMRPLLHRGYDVVGCDASQRMIARARAALGDGPALVVCDMRALPDLGRFDLACCLDDGLNYVLRLHDLRQTFAGIARQLAPGGLLVFDTNTLTTYRGAFSSDRVIDGGSVVLCWRGEGLRELAARRLASATVEIFDRTGSGLWRRSRSRHQQRHWSVADIAAALERGGLRLLAAVGQRTGARLGGVPDEELHTKTVFVAAAA